MTLGVEILESKAVRRVVGALTAPDIVVAQEIIMESSIVINALEVERQAPLIKHVMQLDQDVISKI